VSEQSTLLTVTDYHMLLGQIPASFDFYSNTLPFLNTSILSPLAASGNMYYKYYLVDSVQVQQEKHYLLHFRARNPFQAIFNGEMTIDSASYALRSIKVSLPVQTSVNYLKELTINQKFASTNHLQDESVNLLMDFAVKVAANRDSIHVFPTILYARDTHYSTCSPKSRVSSVDSVSEVILPALDSLNNTPLFKTAKFIAYILQTGCIPTNSVVEVGKIHHLIRMNKVGGVRLGLPLRTTERLWKNVCLESMLAYGTGDRAFKGFGKVSIAFPTERRHTMYLKYNDDYMFSDVDEFQEYLRENKVFNPQVNLITHMMQGWQFNPNYYYNTLTRRQEGRIHFYDEWNKYLETQAYFKTGKSGYGEPTKNYNAQPSIFYATLGASARLSFNERKVDSYFQRRYIYNKMPVVYVGAEIGSYYLEGMPSYRMYGNLQLMLRHNVDLGIGGELNYVLQAGIILGKVPYTFLHHFTANQTYTFDIYRFSLMNNYQYAADQYVSLQAHWNGKGVLFNLIPGIRHARLRELLEFKVAYGGLRQDHESVIPYPVSRQGHTTLNALTIPYVELGVGIGNILRIGELYGVFRLTHLDDLSAPWAAVRFRLHIGM
jgi:hypothetical protein